MTVVGDYLYIFRGLSGGASSYPGLAVINVTDPGAPEWVRLYISRDLAGSFSLATDGDLLFVLSAPFGVQKVWNTEDPADLCLVYEQTSYGRLEDVDIYDDFAYLSFYGESAGIVVMDILDISNPAFVTYLPILDDGVSPRSVISGNYLYTAARSAWIITNLARPNNPEVVYTSDCFAYEVKVQGEYAYVAAGRDGLKIFDISDRRNPVEVGSLPSNRYMTKVEVFGDRAVAIDVGPESYGWVVDISDPANPRSLGQFEPRDNIIHSGIAADNRILVYGEDDIYVRDVLDDNAGIVSHLELGDANEAVALKLLNGDYLIRARFQTGLQIVHLLGDYPGFNDYEIAGYYNYFSHNPYDVTIKYPYVFATDGSALRVFDIRPALGDTLSDRSDPRIADNFRLEPPFPNPFNSTTTISFSVVAQGLAPLRLAIYDINGRLVADLSSAVTALSVTEGSDEAVTHGGMTAEHKVVWDASSFGAGVYFVRLEAGEEVRTQKIVLMR
jgi:hypothetical protein